jgi:glycosyltransferase involved in cell wall biosynthesis
MVMPRTFYANGRILRDIVRYFFLSDPQVDTQVFLGGADKIRVGLEMKVLQIVHAFLPHNTAGVEVYTYNLAKALSLNHQVYVFHRVCDSARKEYEITFSRNGNLRVYSINNTFRDCYSFRGLYLNETIGREFDKILDEIKPDIAHVQHLAFLSADLIRKLKEKNKPIVYTLHDYWLICPQWHSLRNSQNPCEGREEANCLHCLNSWLNIRKHPKLIYQGLKKILPDLIIKKLEATYRFSTKHVSNSLKGLFLVRERKNYMAKLCQDVNLFISLSRFSYDKFYKFGIPGNKNRLIRYGIKINQPTAESRTSTVGQLTFCFIGTILPAKGVHILIEAFNGIDLNSAWLNIYGEFRSYKGFEDYPAKLKKLAKNKNIFFWGGFENTRITEILSKNDILIVPSLWQENSPAVIYEAFCAKVPVIASRIGGIPELINDGINGLLFNPNDVEDLQNKIEFIIANRQLINEFRRNIPRIKSIEENAQEMEQIYLGLTNGQHG